MSKDYRYKNVKIKEEIHADIKMIADATGISIGKLFEVCSYYILKEYRSGAFDKLITQKKKEASS
jgi:hypothetical protein